MLVILIPMPPSLMGRVLAANVAWVILLLDDLRWRTPFGVQHFPLHAVGNNAWPAGVERGLDALILTRAGEDGLEAAGGVMQGFGEFVAGDRIEVGCVIFVIIFVIQFVVITKGATRISEVAARFALDRDAGAARWPSTPT